MGVEADRQGGQQSRGGRDSVWGGVGRREAAPMALLDVFLADFGDVPRTDHHAFVRVISCFWRLV